MLISCHHVPFMRWMASYGIHVWHGYARVMLSSCPYHHARCIITCVDMRACHILIHTCMHVMSREVHVNISQFHVQLDLMQVTEMALDGNTCVDEVLCCHAHAHASCAHACSMSCSCSQYIVNTVSVSPTHPYWQPPMHGVNAYVHMLPR